MLEGRTDMGDMSSYSFHCNRYSYMGRRLNGSEDVCGHCSRGTKMTRRGSLITIQKETNPTEIREVLSSSHSWITRVFHPGGTLREMIGE